jgi:hypothetical protein
VVVFVPSRILQRVLRRVHDGIPLVVVFGLELDGIEGNRDVLLAHSKEPADANDQHADLAVTIDEHIHDFADFGVRGVIDALLVPMRNRHRVGRNAGQYLSGGTLRYSL